MRRTIITAFILVFASLSGAEEITTESVLKTMNAYRKIQGLGPLLPDARLMKAAEDRMRDMEEVGYWAHKSPDGTSPFVWLEKRDFDFSMAGENLAEGFETVEVLVDSWMQSNGHRENILSPNFTSVGIAIIDGRVQRRALGKSIVVLYAREMVRRVPKSELARSEN